MTTKFTAVLLAFIMLLSYCGTGTAVTESGGRYLSGGLNVSSRGLIYEYFLSTDEPQRVLPAATAIRDVETGEEIVLTEYRNGRERSY